MFTWQDAPDGSVMLTLSNAQGKSATIRLTAGELPSLEIETATFKQVMGPSDNTLPDPPPL